MPAMEDSSLRSSAESCCAVSLRCPGGTRVSVIEPCEPESVVRMRETSGRAAQLAALVVKQSEELAQGVSLLQDGKKVLDHCVEVNRLENEADRVSRKAIAELFGTEKDPIQLIKIKELYEVLETATDKAEDAANVLEAVVLKST